MSNEDLVNIRSLLAGEPPGRLIRLGVAGCAAEELLRVFDDALVHRGLAEAQPVPVATKPARKPARKPGRLSRRAA